MIMEGWKGEGCINQGNRVLPHGLSKDFAMEAEEGSYLSDTEKNEAAVLSNKPHVGNEGE